MLTGTCYCGAIRYASPGPAFHHTLCHCSQCRGTTGAPSVAWCTVPAANFRFTAGTPTRFRSSAHGTRSFCPACGTQLTFADDDSPDEIDITICSLDDPATLAPADHTFAGSALAWEKLPDDGLPRYPRRRRDGTGA